MNPSVAPDPLDDPPGPLPDATEASARGVLRGDWRLRAILASVALSTLAYLGFVLWGGWSEVRHAVLQLGLTGLAVALGLSLLNYALRFVRWQGYLQRFGHAVPWRPSLRIYLAGFALTTTPGKLGEALRGVLLKPLGVPWSHSFAAFFSERISDLFAVVLIALLGLSLYPQAQPLVVAGLVLALVGQVVLANDAWSGAVLRRLPADGGGRLTRALGHVLTVFVEARRCHTPAVLLGATLLSVVAWSAEAWAFHFILERLGADVPLRFAMFVYALAMLAGALSFMPGGLGGAEAVMAALLIWKGMSPADAVAATLVIRLATLWFAVAIGAVALGRSR